MQKASVDLSFFNFFALKSMCYPVYCVEDVSQALTGMAPMLL